MLPSARSAFLLLLLASLGTPAWADIYAYTDAHGVTHFSNVPTDSHFQLLLASPPAERRWRRRSWSNRRADS